MENIRIAIDGPASSGKSTVAKIIAKDLGLTYLDTGAMYRAATLVALENDTTSADKIISALTENPLSLTADGEVFLGKQNVTEAIRGNEVTAKVSEIAALTEIRDFLTAEQRRIAADSAIIMDGRDIGTVVLPDAELKIYLVADVVERARRRYKENLERGISADLTELEKEIAARDAYDSTRKVAPLTQAADAIRLDTTGMTIDEVVQFIEKKAKALNA